MSKRILILLAAVVAVSAVFYAYNKREAKAPTVEKNTQAFPAAPAPEKTASSSTPGASPVQKPSGEKTTAKDSGAPDYSAGRYSGTEEAEAGAALDIQVVAVEYDGEKFKPDFAEIKTDDWVFFRNVGKTDFWPQESGSAYPEFNAKKPYVPGSQFKFQFKKAGTWNFKDKLNPSATGTVTVRER